ncbi:MAG: ArsR family transcriptional regulator [Oleispira sp.]|nr:ArsR family transcriptional regulator [Oleispira sp.]
MAYRDILKGDQRLVILRALEESNGTLNDSVLQKVLDTYGHKISRDKVKTHLHWLEEQEFIEIESLLSTDVAIITARGHDIANGRAHVPGVGVPRAGA